MREEKKPMSADDMRLLSTAEQMLSQAQEVMGDMSTQELTASLAYMENQIEALSGASKADESSWPIPRKVLIPLIKMSAAWLAYMIVKNLEEKKEVPDVDSFT
jgi:hypothetical protein